MAEIIQFNETEEGVFECEHCGNQTFFIIIDENDDITHFECANDLCKQRVEFNTITLTSNKDLKDA